MSTKTGHIRLFPMPKNSEVWNLLKSLPEGNPNELVFKGKNGEIIDSDTLGEFWRGNNKKMEKDFLV